MANENFLMLIFVLVGSFLLPSGVSAVCTWNEPFCAPCLAACMLIPWPENVACLTACAFGVTPKEIQRQALRGQRHRRLNSVKG